MNHKQDQTMEKESVNGLQVSPDDGIGSPQRSNSVDSLKVESPSSSTRKGFGLKKWRRIKRDTPAKDEADAAPADDGSKLLKRNLTGFVTPPSKHVDVSSVEARQSSEGSVGSVNMAAHHHHHLLPGGVVNGFSPVTGFMFNVGQGFDKSEEHSGGGKIVPGSQGRRDTIKNGSEERKPCSSIESDLRSSDFVFSSGGGAASHGEKDEQVKTCSRSENGGVKDEDGGDESNNKQKNSLYWADKDHIADSIRCLAALQEALWKEVTSFQELSRETKPLHSNIDEVDSGSQVLILKQKVKHLQHKLEEARADLDAKEARIQELESSMIESELEGVFQRKIEAEIQYLMLTSSLSSLQILKEQPKKVQHSVAQDPEPVLGNMLGKTCKYSFYFLTQLILLVSVLRLLLLQSSPASQLVIPT